VSIYDLGPLDGGVCAHIIAFFIAHQALVPIFSKGFAKPLTKN
jgi:hypothetical protein